MRNFKAGKFLFVWVLAVLLTPCMIGAQDKRTIPLDVYLIVDTSEGFRDARSEIIAWINDQVIDRYLQQGDRLVIWSAGPSARVIHSETIGTAKDEAKNKIRTLENTGKNADFTGALKEAAAKASQENPNGSRISYIILVSGSAENLAPSIEKSSNGLFRWFRAEKYSRWQALVADPNINQKVRQAAAAYMSSR